MARIPFTNDAIPAGQNEPILSVSEAVGEAKGILEDSFPSIRIEGEIANLTKHRNGHWYFSLRDERSSIDCVMFRGSNRRVQFPFEEGLKVVIGAQLSIYAASGRFQAIVSHAEPAGEGLLRFQYEQLRNKLQEEGLFEDGRKQKLPAIPKRIAVISSEHGDAIKDVFTIVRRRFPATRCALVPSLVQGSGAPESLASALHRVAQLRFAPEVVILTRGGGSLEDLWCFNDERVARAIVACPIPIVSAVGHEADVTIADFVADVRASTPSAAAELVVPDAAEISRAVEATEARLVSAVENRLSLGSVRVSQLTSQLSNPTLTVSNSQLKVDGLNHRLSARVHRTLAALTAAFNRDVALFNRASPLLKIAALQERNQHLRRRLRNPIQLLRDHGERAQGYLARMRQAVRNKRSAVETLLESTNVSLVRNSPRHEIARLQTTNAKFLSQLRSLASRKLTAGDAAWQALGRALHLASPLATLDRGYAVVSKPDSSTWGTPITDAREIDAGDEVHAHVAHGTIVSTVKATQPHPTATEETSSE